MSPVVYAAACEDCAFTVESRCDASTHAAAERHARVQEHAVTYNSYDEGGEA